MATDHGRRWMYIKGCRCDKCRESNRAYKAELRAKLHAQLIDPDDPRHGREFFYGDYGCRCDRCVAAKSAVNKERYYDRKKSL